MKGSTLHAVKACLIPSTVFCKPESDKKVGQFFTIYLSVCKNAKRTILTVRTFFDQECYRSVKLLGLLERTPHFVDNGIVSAGYSIAVRSQ